VRLVHLIAQRRGRGCHSHNKGRGSEGGLPNNAAQLPLKLVVLENRECFSMIKLIGGGTTGK
jgi:hypothetical protein